VDLYVIRHAIAEDRVEFRLKSWDDSKRPLSAEGRRKFKKLARKLVKLVGPVDVIVTSPFLRAQQTAKLLSEHYPNVEIITSTTLTPTANPNDFAEWCKNHLKKKTQKVIIVGHEPHMGILASWLLFGSYQSRINLKKGGAIHLKIRNPLGPDSAELQWALSPRCLKGH
jgi:phosphohistidine phosphatase